MLDIAANDLRILPTVVSLRVLFFWFDLIEPFWHYIIDWLVLFLKPVHSLKVSRRSLYCVNHLQVSDLYLLGPGDHCNHAAVPTTGLIIHEPLYGEFSKSQHEAAIWAVFFDFCLMRQLPCSSNDQFSGNTYVSHYLLLSLLGCLSEIHTDKQ